MLQLVIEPLGARPGMQVSVADSVPIGAFVSALVDQLGYPKIDGTGVPIAYQLRPSTGDRPLPNAQSFATAKVASGAHLALVAEAASFATVPLEAPGREIMPLPQRWTRRAVTTAGIVVCLCAFTGFGAGFAVALARRHAAGLQPPPVVASSPAVTATVGVPRTATVQFTFSGHLQTVRSVAFSPDGSFLASGGDDGQLLVWSALDGGVRQRMFHPASVQALAWSPEGQRLVTGSANQVRFYAAFTGTLLARSSRHTAPVASLAWTAHNQMQVVSGALDQLAIIWDTANYQAQTIFARHNKPIEAVSWAADGQSVASSSQGGVVRVWNAATGEEIHGLYQDAPIPMRACAFAPTGAALAVGGDDGIIRVWNNGLFCQEPAMGSGGQMCQDKPLRLRTSNQPIRTLAWCPDARYLASGSNDGTFSIWMPGQSQAPVLTMLIQPNVAVHSIGWSPHATQLATASGTAISVWNLHA